jgi:ribonuclease T2
MTFLPTLFVIFTQFYVPNVQNRTRYDDYLFTIHGLWPEYNNNTYPEYCNKSIPFNVSELRDLIPRLDVGWVSYEGNNTDFWKHEFEKHGTCFSEPDIYHSYNTTNLFSQSSLKVGQKYLYQNVSKSLNNAVLQCKEREDKLEQVWYCMTMDSQPFTCPSWLNNTCPDVVQL